MTNGLTPPAVPVPAPGAECIPGLVLLRCPDWFTRLVAAASVPDMDERCAALDDLLCAMIKELRDE